MILSNKALIKLEDNLKSILNSNKPINNNVSIVGHQIQNLFMIKFSINILWINACS